MTVVINMLGGSGIGKSTIAAGLYYNMKLQHMNVELVREYVKILAWQGAKISRFDQVNIFGEQCKLEHTLYNKVDYIVTDSPIILAPIYEIFYHNDSIMEEAALKLLSKAKESGVKQLNLVLDRNKPYDTKGRFQTEDQARVVDKLTLDFLNKYNIAYTTITGCEQDKVSKIMELVINEQKERS